MSMPGKPLEATVADRVPARSGTPAAWAALLLVGLLIGAWSLRTPLLCAALRHLAPVVAWKQGQSLGLGSIARRPDGAFVVTGIDWARGNGPHRSTFRCDEAVVRFRPLANIVWSGSAPDEDPWIRSLSLTKTKVLVDLRGKNPQSSPSAAPSEDALRFMRLMLPGSLKVTSAEIVVIGESGRVAVRGLSLDLPSGWPGTLSFDSAETELGAGHRSMPGATSPARWEPGFLRLGPLPLGKGLALDELSVRAVRGGVEFGLSGTIGKGLLRADGSLGGARPMEATFVGERLALDAVTGIIADTSGASGTIDQARLTFRGDPDKPMDADASLRLVGKNFRWQGRGWESLRLVATMTGRNLTVSEFSLRQGENELRAAVRSSLPAQWRALLRAPFTAEFQASLPDAGVLPTLLGPRVPVTGGILHLDGMVRGADNRAEGYCNFSGVGTKIRRLPLDWIRGCLLFEGGTTRVAYAEAHAGNDAVSVEGSISNSGPHAYEGVAEVRVDDLAARLSEVGLSVPADLGAGSVSAKWRGGGDVTRHWGSFEGRVSEWVSRRSRTGISGNFAGSYAPGKVVFDRAQILQGDMNLAFGMTAGTSGLEVRGITLQRKGVESPLATGEVFLPVDLGGIWNGANPWNTLALEKPLAASLTVEGLDLARLSELLGQPSGLGGRVSGKIAASGLASAPDLNADLRIDRFSVNGKTAGDVTVAAARLSNGTRFQLDQRVAREQPMHIDLLLPLGLSRVGGDVVLAPEAALSGIAELHRAALDPWLSLTGFGVTLHAASAVAEGSLAFAGTVCKPQVTGSMALKASACTAAGAISLAGADLPLSFSGTKVSATNGSASYHGKPVVISGEAEWASAGQSALRISGDSLPVDLLPGISGTGRVDLVWKADATANGLLVGQVQLQPIMADLQSTITPAFCPPGFRMDKPPVTPTDTARLDIELKTLPSSRPDKASVEADLHLGGTLAQPLASGTVTLRNQTLRLPAGTFGMRNCTITCDGGRTKIDGDATGMGRSGLENLTLCGTLENPQVLPLATRDTSATSVFALLMTAFSSTPVTQAPFWLRQEMLFPAPSRSWAYPSGESTAAGLGFHGVPWIWNLRTFRACTQ
jgi:hypothetical protein